MLLQLLMNLLIVALLTIDDQMLHKLNSVKPFASIPSFLNLFKILDLSEESPFLKREPIRTLSAHDPIIIRCHL